MGDLGEIPIDKKPRNGHGIILFPFPLQGHMNSMLQLANILHSHGFSITIIHTTFNSPSPSKFPHFSFRSIPDGLDPDSAVLDVIKLLVVLNVNCVEPFRACLREIISPKASSDKDRVSCLIADGVWHFSQSIADEHGIRRMELRTTSMSSFRAFSALTVLYKKGFLPEQDIAKLEEPLMDLWPLRFKDLPTVKTENPDDLYRLLKNMIKALKSSSGIIANSFEELEPPELAEGGKLKLNVPVFSIGPFNKYFPASSSSLMEEDVSALSWLDKQEQNSVLYVSFGSLASIDPARFREMANGLMESEQPFVWVVRPGLVGGPDPLTEGFAEGIKGRGITVRWAPQQELLVHQAVGGFWTHCGWNSTLDSVCEGVPMICMPLFGDQKMNARFIGHVWRVGLQLEDNANREEIKSVIRRLMVSEEGEEIRTRMKDLKEKVDCCVKPGGSSYNALHKLIHHLLSF